MKQMTHTVTLVTKDGFGSYSKRTIRVRLLKHHIIDVFGTKYRKDNGYIVGGCKWKGVYVESDSLDVNTLSAIKPNRDSSNEQP